jgi:hypothetical protein
MSDGLGIVISSRKGDLQAFRHEGDLSNAQLVRYLRKYADPAYVVRATHENPSRKAKPLAARPRYSAQIAAPMMGGMMGGCRS